MLDNKFSSNRTQKTEQNQPSTLTAPHQQQQLIVVELEKRASRLIKKLSFFVRAS